eukprot:12304153-Alexandrium_andersonii.AAC.1
MLGSHPVAPKRFTLYSHRLALHVGYLFFLRKQHAELRSKSTDFATYWGVGSSPQMKRDFLMVHCCRVGAEDR